jgi:hypothetical protein
MAQNQEIAEFHKQCDELHAETPQQTTLIRPKQSTAANWQVHRMRISRSRRLPTRKFLRQNQHVDLVDLRWLQGQWDWANTRRDSDV